MPASPKPDPEKATEEKTKAATPERAPVESNYGYESDHPSYRLRKAGDWTPTRPASKDYRPTDPPEPDDNSKP